MEQNEQQKQYKCKISFDQGKNGIISFSGYIHFDSSDNQAMVYNSEQLLSMLQMVEYRFKTAGYKIATDVKPKGSEKDE